MRILNLIKITDKDGTIIYQGVSDDELESIYNTQAGYSYIGRNFEVEELGEVNIYQESYEITKLIKLCQQIVKEAEGCLDYGLVTVDKIQEMKELVSDDT